MNFATLLTAFIATSYSTLAFAQQPTKVAEVILAPNESARGVDFEWPNAYVSLFTNGEQRVIDLNTFTQVAAFNPNYGDQWAEAIVVAGDFISGHRFGGLNLWDVTGVPTPLDSIATTYHFDGLGMLPIAGQAVLLYSESDISPLDAGLRVYDITNGTLNNIGNAVAANDVRDGRFLLSTSDLWVYQLDGGASSNRPLNLNVYDLGVNGSPTNPLFVQQFNMGNAVGSYGGLTDLALDPTERILYAACGSDGLRMIDIGNRPNPVVVNTYSGTGYYVRELDFLDGTVYMAVSVRLPNQQWRFTVLDCTIAGSPVPIWGWGNWFGDQDYQINDIKLTGLATGPALLIAGKNVLGEATLQIWM
jgi:hypothetical protein